MNMPEIRDGINAILSAQNKRQPSHVNRISQLGHNCERYLYYTRAEWDKAAPVSPELQGIFNTGNIIEDIAIPNFNLAGAKTTPRMRLIGTKMSVKDDLLAKYKISGTSDAFLQIEIPDMPDKWETVASVDVKSCSQNIYPHMNTLEDCQRYTWTVKYPGQTMLYSFGNNLSMGGILWVNKQNLWDFKLMMFDVDLEYVESLLKKAERINTAVDTKTPPKKLNEPDTCSRCEFQSFCMPELTTGKELVMSDNEALAQLLEEKAELEPIAKKYDAIVDQIEGKLVKGQDIICGKFMIKWQEIKGFKKPSGGGEYIMWRKKYLRLDGETNIDDS